MLHAQVMILILRRVGALFRVVGADAEISIRRAEHVVAEAKRLIERERVVGLREDVDVVARRPHAQRFRAYSAGKRRVDIGRVVGVQPAHVQIERALLFHERSTESKVVVPDLLRTLRRRERAPAAHRSASEPEAGVITDRPKAGLRDDLDECAARPVVLCRKLIARDSDRSDLRLGRQRAAFEAIDPDDRSGARHVLQLLP